MASMVTIYIANVIEKSITDIEVQDRLCSSEKLMLFFKVKVISDKIPHICCPFYKSNEAGEGRVTWTSY